MSHEIDRRTMLRLGALGLAAPALATGAATPALASTTAARTTRTTRTSRSQADAAADRIVASVRRPWFPPRNFPVTDFGAVGDGTTKNTAAFTAAIAACHRAGGGHVIVPSGIFLTGAIHLLSNVDLHVESGATVLFSQDPNDYLPVVFTRWQGIELMNYSPFIYSYGQRNIAVSGAGTLNGQADANHWWNWKNLETNDFDALETMADDNVPVAQRVFGSGHFLPPQMIQP
ncbi:MAG: glycosyl hydrolase family 28-related protein, partial [Streptosporangiaceae bacterium]